MQRHLLVADLPEDVDAPARRPGQGRRELVLVHATLERLAQRVLGLEEAVRRHQAADPLMRTQVVVVREVVPQALTRLAQLLRLHALPQLRANRRP